MNIAIIGAGAAGLSAAHDLNQAGHRVTIFEAAPGIGGLASGFKAPHWDWTLEKFYHHWFQTDRDILGLIDELGWSDQVLFPRPYTVIYHDGRFHPFDSPFTNIPLFLLRHFSLLDVIRFGLVGVYLKLTSNWRSLEKVTADAWMRRWCGDRVYEVMWKPLLVSKFGEENLNVVNMAWLWARFKARTTRLGTFVGGFQRFLDRFADHLKQRGVAFRLSTPVDCIRPRPDGGVTLQTATGDEAFDACITTTSPALLARMAPDLPKDYLDQLLALKSMGAVVLILSLDRPLTGYYWHNLPKHAGFPFLALVEHTNYVSPDHFGGDRLIYCGDYLPADHPHFKASKEELLDKFLPSLKRFNPDFDPAWVKDSWLFRTPYAQPIPPVNHSRAIPDLETPIPGLWFASMSQVYPWDRGTNFAVEIGRRVARRLMQSREHRAEAAGSR